MSELWTTFWQLFQTLGLFLVEVGRILFHWSLAIFAVAWVGFAIDWRKLGPALRGGAILPMLLIAIMSAFVWGFLVPQDAKFLGTTVPNFLWQVIATGLLLGLMLFCGSLQMKYAWFPPEIEIEPAGGHDHGHGHDDHHGHSEHGHGDEHGHGEDEGEADDDEPAEPPPVPPGKVSPGH